MAASQAYIYLTHNGKTGLLIVAKKALIMEHSALARETFKAAASGTGDARVDISGSSPGPLRWVLAEAGKHGNALRIRTSGRTFPDSVALYQAIEALQLEPTQPQVYGHLKGYIAHAVMNPEDIRAIQQAFGHLEHGSELWCMAIHHLAWHFVQGTKYTQAQYVAVVDECAKYPRLHLALLARINELEQREAAKVEKRAKRETMEARKKKRAEHDQKANDANRRAQEFKETRVWEEKHGLRAVSDNTVDYIMQRKVVYKITDRTKKNTSGQHDAQEE